MIKTLLLTVSLTFACMGLMAQVPNTKSPSLDRDGDSIFDACDADSDNDGIPDIWEDININANYGDDDTDGDLLIIPQLGDGLSSYLDLDSENDGVLDLFESGIPVDIINLIDKDRNGIIDGNIGVGQNGFADILETFPDSGVPKYALMNTDGDDKPDFIDFTANGNDYDLYVIGKDNLDQLGGGFITPIDDADKDGVQAVADADLANRGAPGSPLSPYAPATGGMAYSGAGNANAAVSSECAFVLPVVWGNVEAFMANNRLQVNWQTLTERGNSYFNIEVSADGEKFVSIGSVQSKADQGDSDLPINYSFSKDAGAAGRALGFIAILGLSGLALTKRRKLMLAITTIGIWAAVSCNKANDTWNSDSSDQLFVHIKQVDTNGTFKFSKTVKVLKK